MNGFPCIIDLTVHSFKIFYDDEPVHERTKLNKIEMGGFGRCKSSASSY